jgi:hypothetical protein
LAHIAKHMVDNLFSGMLSSRLAEIAQKPGAPLLRLLRARPVYCEKQDDASLEAVVKDGGC